MHASLLIYNYKIHVYQKGCATSYVNFETALP